MMTADVIKQFLGNYIIYSRNNNKDYEINLIDTNTPGTNIGLKSFQTCNSKHKLQRCLGKSIVIVSCIATKFLSCQQEYCTYFNLWSPVVCYYLPVSTITANQCRIITLSILCQIVLRMGFYRTIIHTVLFSPKIYGGYGLINIFTEQYLGTIKCLLKNLRSKSEVSQVLLIFLSFL